MPADVRIARHGSQQFALTADDVLGRVTIGFDDDGDGYRAAALTPELPTGLENSSTSATT